jgi:hypothetical protein
MNAIVKRIELPGHSRLIAISDIHGNLPLLQKLLQKVDYTGGHHRKGALEPGDPAVYHVPFGGKQGLYRKRKL